MAPILYYVPQSPPVRATQLTAAALNLELELKLVNFFEKENQSEEYLKINPAHTVPTLVDDGFIVWDSHAIMAYLVGKYGKKDTTLYPTELKARATVDQFLHFSNSVIFNRIFRLARPLMEGKKQDPEQLELVHDGLKTLESCIGITKKFITGCNVTIADFSLIAAITSFTVVNPIDPGKYPNITRWIKNMEALPYYHVNQRGIEALTALFSQLQQAA